MRCTLAVLSGVKRCVGTWRVGGNSRGYDFGRSAPFGSGWQTAETGGQCTVRDGQSGVRRTLAVLSGVKRCVCKRQRFCKVSYQDEAVDVFFPLQT